MRLKLEVEKMNLKEITDLLKQYGISKEKQCEAISANGYTFRNMMRKEKLDEPRAMAMANQIRKAYQDELDQIVNEQNETSDGKQEKTEIERLRAENEKLTKALIGMITSENLLTDEELRLIMIVEQKLNPILVKLEELKKQSGQGRKTYYGEVTEAVAA